jgi:hypothetical protein
VSKTCRDSPRRLPGSRELVQIIQMTIARVQDFAVEVYGKYKDVRRCAGKLTRCGPFRGNGVYTIDVRLWWQSSILHCSIAGEQPTQLTKSIYRNLSDVILETSGGGHNLNCMDTSRNEAAIYQNGCYLPDPPYSLSAPVWHTRGCTL